MNTLSFITSLGWITVSEEKNSITSVKFGKKRNKGKNKILVKSKIQINEFIKGKRKKFKLKICIRGTTLQKKIWNQLNKIDYGSTKSYGEIAKLLNTSPRYVGNVCGQNNHLILIPCHRVIRSDGSLGGFSSLGGIKLKNKLLKLEKSR